MVECVFVIFHVIPVAPPAALGPTVARAEPERAPPARARAARTIIKAVIRGWESAAWRLELGLRLAHGMPHGHALAPRDAAAAGGAA